jgi:hypothetical protein
MTLDTVIFHIGGLDAICLVMLLDHFKLSDLEENIPFPVDFQDISDQQKINWLNNICGIIIKKFFFENEADMCASVFEVCNYFSPFLLHFSYSVDYERNKLCLHHFHFLYQMQVFGLPVKDTDIKSK